MRFILIILLAVLAAVALSQYVSRVDLPFLAGILFFAFMLGVAFLRGTEALYIVIIATLFSPEIGSGLATGKGTGEGAAGVVIRLEDVVLVAVGLGWILRSAYLRSRFGIVRTPVLGAIGIYMAVSVIATLLGVLDRTVKLDVGLFHNAKYFEYFFLFLMILAHVRSTQMIRRLVGTTIAVFLCAAAYGYLQIVQGIRVTAPFDTEPNTFGGYMVLVFCVLGGIILYDPRLRVRSLLTALALFAFPPFLFTLSRSSYIALLAGLVTFMVISKRRVGVAIATAGVAAAIGVGLIAIPEKVERRVTGTFEKGTQYHVQVAGVDLDPSASARVISYDEAVQTWLKKPLFGHGVTGTYFIDGQYWRLLAETGIIGLAAFLMIFLRLLNGTLQAYATCPAEDGFLKGTALGFFAGIVAMMTHALFTNSFIIVRIAEPFWMLAGLVLLIPYCARLEAEGLPEAD